MALNGAVHHNSPLVEQPKLTCKEIRSLHWIEIITRNSCQEGLDTNKEKSAELNGVLRAQTILLTGAISSGLEFSRLIGRILEIWLKGQH